MNYKLENLEENNLFHKYKYLMILGMLYITFDLAGNVIIYRIVKVSYFMLPGGIFSLPFLYCISDVITEIYGFKAAKILIWMGILCDIMFSLFLMSNILLPSNIPIIAQEEYKHIINPIFRGIIGSAIAFITGRFINVYIISKTKIILKGKHFWLRSFLASLIGELIVLIIGVICIFGGMVSKEILFQLFISDYLFRIIFTTILIIPSTIVVCYIKNKTGINVYDIKSSYNPFNLKR